MYYHSARRLPGPEHGVGAEGRECVLQGAAWELVLSAGAAVPDFDGWARDDDDAVDAGCEQVRHR